MTKFAQVVEGDQSKPNHLISSAVTCKKQSLYMWPSTVCPNNTPYIVCRKHYAGLKRFIVYSGLNCYIISNFYTYLKRYCISYNKHPIQKIIPYCFTLCCFSDYTLEFPKQGVTDYVQIWGMRSLTQFTVCFWLKTTLPKGTAFSYASNGANNDLLIDYESSGRLLLSIGNKAV